jgi:hypothetical protein
MYFIANIVSLDISFMERGFTLYFHIQNWLQIHPPTDQLTLLCYEKMATFEPFRFQIIKLRITINTVFTSYTIQFNNTNPYIPYTTLLTGNAFCIMKYSFQSTDDKAFLHNRHDRHVIRLLYSDWRSMPAVLTKLRINKIQKFIILNFNLLYGICI